MTLSQSIEAVRAPVIDTLRHRDTCTILPVKQKQFKFWSLLLASSRVLARRALFRAPDLAVVLNSTEGRIVLNSTEGRIHVRTDFSVVLISTENEKRVTSPRHSPPYFVLVYDRLQCRKRTK